MIITRLLGGLGNQMFQYAAGLALAHRHRTVLKLDVSWFGADPAYEDHNRYALDCFNVTAQFATRDEVERMQGIRLTRIERVSVALARGLHFYRYADRHSSPARRYAPPDARFDARFGDQADDTYLEGMFQSERYFADVAGILRQHFSFRYPPLPAVAAMARRIAEGPSVAIHFRRGDYVTNGLFNRDIGVLGSDYYERAIELLRDRHPESTLYVFSDDIDTVEREFRPGLPHVFVRATQPWHAYDKIRLMSACRHAVISNSTFAWWAAWLNPSPDKMIVAPDPWFANTAHDGRDIVPDTWQRLPRA